MNGESPGIGGGRPEKGESIDDVIDVREHLASLRREGIQRERVLPAYVVRFFNASEQTLEEMDRERNPAIVFDAIEQLEGDYTKLAMELDLDASGAPQSELVDRLHDLMPKMSRYVPGGDPGTVPVSVFQAVSDQFWSAKHFIEVAVEKWHRGEGDKGSLDAARDAAWGAIAKLYEGIVTLPPPK